MKKFVVTAVLQVLLISANCQPIVLETKKILDDQVEILVPTTFKIMPEEMLQLKYPSANRPTLVYTDEDGTVNVAFNHTKSAVAQSQVEGYKNMLVATLEKTFPTAEWEGKGVQEINGKKVGFLEVTTQAIDTKIYNLLFFTDLDGRLLICTFNCTVQKKATWVQYAKQILNSLTIKPAPAKKS